MDFGILETKMYVLKWKDFI